MDPWCLRPAEFVEAWTRTANVSPPLVLFAVPPLDKFGVGDTRANTPGAGFTNISVRIKKAALL
jgi:hypothetical protein